MSNLKEKKLFLLDMDGTIYLGDEIFDGTIDFLNYLKETGKRYMFLTNNSSKSVNAYIKKLDKMGIKTTSEDFFTSTDATIYYLKSKNYNKIYALGTASFKEQLKIENLPITDKLEDGIDCLCMGFDTELTFKKLEDACILLTKDIDYIATNPDWVCPTSFGFVPDCGSISSILKNATGKMPYFIGKPQPLMVELAIKKANLTKNDAVLFGDRLYTDIACGVNAGISTVFVLSGEGTMDDVEKSKEKPEFIFDDIKQVYNFLKEA